jgi:hypothetical protein
MNFYKDNSNPLVRVSIGDLVPGEIYVNDEGIRLLYGIDGDGQPSMDIIQFSELNLGFTMDDLVIGSDWYSRKLVRTFWALMRSKRRAQ